MYKQYICVCMCAYVCVNKYTQVPPNIKLAGKALPTERKPVNFLVH